MASAREARDVPAHSLGPRRLLLATVRALLLIGLVMVYSASTVEALSEGSDPASYLFDQIKFAVIGVV